MITTMDGVNASADACVEALAQCGAGSDMERAIVIAAISGSIDGTLERIAQGLDRLSASARPDAGRAAYADAAATVRQEKTRR